MPLKKFLRKKSVLELIPREPVAELIAAAAEPTSEPVAPKPANEDLQSRELRVIWSWASRELAHWLRAPLDMESARKAFDALNESSHTAYIYEVRYGVVELLEKPEIIRKPESHPYTIRAKIYRSFLQDIITRFLPNLNIVLSVSAGDNPSSYPGLPTFCHQKISENVILVPDIDFISNSYYENEPFVDRVSYDDKSISAVFHGSTTGAIITLDMVRRLSLPRLSAAQHFWTHPDISFTMPLITQCEDDEVRAALSELPYCGGHTVSWESQLNHKFLISIDGNGATCSRVVASLLSNSVLLKYDSPYQLYYFPSLTPWVHYVPISKHSDIEEIIDIEHSQTGYFRNIAACGRDFAKSYLARENVEFYMASLLTIYSSCFTLQCGSQHPLSRRNDAFEELLVVMQGEHVLRSRGAF